MKTYELTALSAQVYDARSQLNVAWHALAEMHELTELVKDGLCVTLENVQDVLEGVEEKLSPTPIGKLAEKAVKGQLVEFPYVVGALS